MSTKRTTGFAEESALERVGYTAAGAAGAAILGAFLTREGWAPKTIASLLTAAGGAAAWSGGDPRVQNAGAGAMSAAGGQLTLMLLDERERQAAAPAAASARRLASAGDIPPGALEAAFERAQRRFAVDDAERDPRRGS